MPRSKYGFDEAKIARFLKEGRGAGRGPSYKPWLTIQDVPSHGRSHRFVGRVTGRLHHLLSDLEYRTLLIYDWSRIVTDIREQFPLDRDDTRRHAGAAPRRPAPGVDRRMAAGADPPPPAGRPPAAPCSPGSPARSGGTSGTPVPGSRPAPLPRGRSRLRRAPDGPRRRGRRSTCGGTRARRRCGDGPAACDPSEPRSAMETLSQRTGYVGRSGTKGDSDEVVAHAGEGARARSDHAAPSASR